MATLSDEDMRRLLRRYFSSLFPKICPNCGYRYENVRQYAHETAAIPGPLSYDAELQDWTPLAPMGGYVASNCRCGSTLALSFELMPVHDQHKVLAWIKARCTERRISPRDLLEDIRRQVRADLTAEDRS